MGDGMIDHLAMKHVKNYYLRVGIVIVWNLLGMVTMWWAMMSGYSLDNLAVIGGGMFLAGCFALAYKARVPEEYDE